MNDQQLLSSLLFCGVMSKRMLMHTLLCFPQIALCSPDLNNRLSYILPSLFSPSHPGSCSLVCRPLLPSLTTRSYIRSVGRLSHNNVFISILIGLLPSHLMRSPPLGFFPGTYSVSNTFIVMSSWLSCRMCPINYDTC